MDARIILDTLALEAQGSRQAPHRGLTGQLVRKVLNTSQAVTIQILLKAPTAGPKGTIMTRSEGSA